MPERLTTEESAQLKALFDRATGLTLQLPTAPTAVNFITEFWWAVRNAYKQIEEDGDPRKQHARPKRPWDD